MITFALDENNDLYMNSQNQLAMITGVQSLEQSCKTTMQVRLGELIYNVTAGMPYLESVFANKNFRAFEFAARNALLNLPGVQNILSFDFLQEGDILKYVAVIQTETGVITING